MDAILKIEAALAAVESLPKWGPKWGPKRLNWMASKDHAPGELGTDPVIIYVETEDVSPNSVDILFEADWGTQEDANLIEACNPTAIREVLQTLASKEAEVARLRAMADEYENWIRCYHSGGDFGEFLRAALTPQPPKELK